MKNYYYFTTNTNGVEEIYMDISKIQIWGGKSDRKVNETNCDQKNKKIKLNVFELDYTNMC